MPSVTKLVREAMHSRLQSAWSAAVSAAESGYDVAAADLTRLTGIDWQQAQKYRQVILGGPVDWDDLQATTSIVFPAVQIYALDATDDGESKFKAFSGNVTGYVEIAWTWRPSAALNFEEIPDLIQDALLAVFRDRNWLGALGQSGLTHNAGGLSLSLGQVTKADQNWRQVITLAMRFGVDV